MSKPNFWWVLFSRKHVYNMWVAYPMWATLNHMHIVLAKVTHVGDPQHSQRQRNWHGWSGPRSVLLKCLGCWFINGCCFQHAISTRWLLNAIRGCSHFTHSFWSPYEYLSHCQSEDFHAHYMLIYLPAPPPNYVTYWTYNGHHILSMQTNLFQKHVFFVSTLGVTPNHVPLKYRCPNRKQTKAGWSTFNRFTLKH